MAIIYYSERQIGLIREASKVVAECHAIVKKLITPGVTTRQIDRAVAEHIKNRGGSSPFLHYKLPKKEPFPGTVCASVNDVVVHGWGDDTPLKDGDLVAIDVGVRLNGYIGDSAWTYGVGTPDEGAKKLLRVGEEALRIGIHTMKPNGFLGELCEAIQHFVEEHGFSVVRDYVGHGVGSELHEEPQVPNYVDRQIRKHVYSIRLKPGMVLAVEPMVNEGQAEVHSEEGKWPVRTKDGGRSVHFEHTVAVFNDRIEVLTMKSDDRMS